MHIVQILKFLSQLFDPRCGRNGGSRQYAAPALRSAKDTLPAQ